MDPPLSVETETELGAAAMAVGQKRSIENGDALSVKKRRCWLDSGAMKQVAEILLVLSAMVKMRGGGRNPTDAELGLMEEARKLLVNICEELAPKDIVESDAIGAVIEDLGLNWKQKDQKLGFKMPRLTISERFLTAKKKIEESKKHQASSPQPLQTGPVRASTVNSSVPGSHFGRDSSSLGFSRVENPQANTASYVPASSSANHPVVNAPTWSMQSQTAASNKLSKFEGSSNVSISRTPSVTLSTNHGQAPSLISKHDEIAKIVQKFLQPKLPEQRTWNPPSREYMNKALACQTCKITVNEVETVLICDACEKGYHLKCLQPNIQKAIPRGEWHCRRCLSLCNGKPLPPKYGRVMRSTSTPKPPSNSAEVQASSENKIGKPDAKVTPPPKVLDNGRSSLQTTAVPGIPSDPNNILDAKNPLSSGRVEDQGTSTETDIHRGFPVDSSSERSSERPKISESSTTEEHGDPESKSQPPESTRGGDKEDSVMRADADGNDQVKPRELEVDHSF